jgi:hypothetical protein
MCVRRAVHVFVLYGLLSPIVKIGLKCEPRAVGPCRLKRRDVLRGCCCSLAECRNLFIHSTSADGTASHEGSHCTPKEGFWEPPYFIKLVSSHV